MKIIVSMYRKECGMSQLTLSYYLVTDPEMASLVEVVTFMFENIEYRFIKFFVYSDFISQIVHLLSKVTMKSIY